MLIPQIAATWYLYMAGSTIDYYEPFQKQLISGVATDLGCRTACDYSSNCVQYILQTDKISSATSCYHVATSVYVYTDRVWHPKLKNIIIGQKVSTVTPQNYNVATFAALLGISASSFQTCYSTGKSVLPLTEVIGSNCGLLPPKVGFRLGIDGNYCSTKLIFRPFSCDPTGLIATKW